MPAAPAHVLLQRGAEIGRGGERKREGPRVEKRHVGPLTELRARRVRRISDRDHPLARRPGDRVVGVAGKRELVGIVEGVEERCGLRPERQRALLPGLQSLFAPQRVEVRSQAPEEGCERALAFPATPDRQHADHDARFLVALLERVLVERAGGPGQRGP